MDAQRFDAFVRALGLNSARRGMVAGLLGGGVASLVAALTSEARRRAHRHDGQHEDLSAEKRKKRKKKKHKKRKKKESPPIDEAPPCTADSCPLPPGCSEQVLEGCAAALHEALLADAEPCRSLCEDDAESPACRECIEPYALARQPDSEACAVESCSSPSRAAAPRAGHTAAREWWTRTCDKPCCFRELEACKEDAVETYVPCLIASVASCFSPAAPLCPLAIEGCLFKATYDIAKCNARNGCPAFDACKSDNTCCPSGTSACNTGCCGSTSRCWSCGTVGSQCCPSNTKVCCNGTCCSSDNAKCCGTRTACYGKEVDCSALGG